MNPISFGLDLLLAVLLVATFAMGWQVNRRLKGLKQSQAGFVDAVAQLDRAAQHAEAGLDQLRAATDEALELLSGRIEKARELVVKLEALNAEAFALTRSQPSPSPAPQPSPAPASMLAERVRPVSSPSAAGAIAAAEAVVRKLSEDRLDEPRSATAALRPGRPTPMRAPIDDDLFETPAAFPAGDATLRGRL